MLRLIQRLMLSFLLTLVVLYVGLLWVARRSDRIIFQPQPSSYSDHGITAPYQLFHITSGASGPHTLTGAASITTLYLPNPDARFTLLMSHGNAEDIGQNRELYEEYRRRGFAVFAYDYRGYGTSTGTPTEQGIYADEYAAWEYLVNTLRVSPSLIILHGTSVGSGPAVELAERLSIADQDQRPAALILVAPFRSAFTVLTKVPLVPWDKFPNARRIRNVRMPVLVIQGEADEVIPFAHGQKVFHNAQPKGDKDASLMRTSGKQHLWIPNAGHNDIFQAAPKLYFDKVQSFANEIPLN
ncbi:MAG TPA: alpha/beta hydrolase [Acidobacteriaceae bacterium]